MMIETVTIEEEIYFVFSEWIAEQGLNFIITISPPSFFLLRMEQKREKTFLRLTFKRKVGVAGFNKILVWCLQYFLAVRGNKNWINMIRAANIASMQTVDTIQLNWLGLTIASIGQLAQNWSIAASPCLDRLVFISFSRSLAVEQVNGSKLMAAGSIKLSLLQEPKVGNKSELSMSPLLVIKSIQISAGSKTECLINGHIPRNITLLHHFLISENDKLVSYLSQSSLAGCCWSQFR